jgi:molybdenum cofactor cytidylyltransferase
MISGILLAAGESTRMGGAFKPLLPWGKRTVIGACVENLRRSRLDEIVVVLGHREAEIRPRLAGSGVVYAINHDYRRGMLSSVQTGIAEISPQSDAMMIALVDQPTVGPEIIDRLIAAYEGGGKKIVLPEHGGRHGHPIVISRDYWDDILRLDAAAAEGLGAFIATHRDECLEVPIDSPAVLDDIDRPEDYERLGKQVAPLYEYHKWHP